MTSQVSDGEIKPADVLSVTMEFFREAAEALAGSLQNVKSGSYDEAKTVVTQVRDLKAAFQLVMEERTRVEKLRKDDKGIAYDFALDLDAARDEIGRRLACLRDAGES
jgi:hypothetical protein